MHTCAEGVYRPGAHMERLCGSHGAVELTYSLQVGHEKGTFLNRRLHSSTTRRTARPAAAMVRLPTLQRAT